jgi:general secretion pathway protein E/type IV pilus assembly protein PilB
MDALIARRGHMDELREVAKARGFVTLAEDGIRRVMEGYTSISEVSRVVDLTGRLH